MSAHIDTLGTIVKIDGTIITGISLDTIPIPDGDTGDKDTSTLDSGTIMDKGLGMFDPGSCEISGNKISGDAGQLALTEAYGDRALHTFTVDVVPAGEIYTYEGYVTKFNPGSSDNTYIFSSKILASGAFTLATAYAGITSIDATESAVVCYPALATSALPATANDVTIVEATGTTTDSITVVAAAADYIGISYWTGSKWTTWTELTTSVAATFSTTYWPDAGAVAKARIKVEEEDKATRFVNLFVCRESS